MPAASQTVAQVRSKRRPTAKAAKWPSATARKASPVRAQRKKAVRVATKTPAIAAATRSKVEMKTPATWNWASEMPRYRRCIPVPQMIWATPSMMQDRPRVAINSIIGARWARGRSTVRPMAKPRATTMAAKMIGAKMKGPRHRLCPGYHQLAQPTFRACCRW